MPSVARSNTCTALPNAPGANVAAIAGPPGEAVAVRSSQCEAPNTAATRMAATADACQGRRGKDSRRGNLRSHGNAMISAATVVTTPARNQNNAMQSLLSRPQVAPTVR